MKQIKILLILLMFNCSYVLSEKREQLDNECDCYCSVKCGARKTGEVAGDSRPFYNAEHGKCFCQQRDLDLYLPNKCDEKEKNNPTKLNPNCCEIS